SLINFADDSYKTFVKRFDPQTNNWEAQTTQNINNQFNFGEGILVMPNYSLDNRLISTSRIISKGVLYNNLNLNYNFENRDSRYFVPLSNNYQSSIDLETFYSENSYLMQGQLFYVFNSDNAKWDNNIQSVNPVRRIKPSEGFFVVASSANGNFKINKGQIVNSSGAKNSYIRDLIYVKTKTNSQEREAFLEYNEEAENGFDFNDGIMLFGSNENAVEPFFRINAAEEPFDSSIDDLNILKDAFSTLPYMTELGLRSQKNNDLSLNFSNITSDIHVYLLDSLLRIAQYMNEKPDYSLKVGEGDNRNRLFVKITYSKEDVNEFFKPDLFEDIKIWNYNNILHIEGTNIIRYELYDIIGNKILENEISEDDYQIELSLKNGIYIVRAYSQTGSKTEKLSIFN
ncbi:MAG: T9SS type A sorting domain-containing protein, partial [Bacteroidales bacterium]